MTFGAHKLVHSEPFLDYLSSVKYRFWRISEKISEPVQASSSLFNPVPVLAHFWKFPVRDSDA